MIAVDQLQLGYNKAVTGVKLGLRMVVRATIGRATAQGTEIVGRQ